MPFFNVTLAEGHPLQAPFNSTVTILFAKDFNVIAPPSASTAGATYSSRIEIIF